MLTKYKHGEDVPLEALTKRLDELSTAITKGKPAIDREFVMRIPAEVDFCPDLVIAEASKRLANQKSFQEQLSQYARTVKANMDSFFAEFYPTVVSSPESLTSLMFSEYWVSASIFTSVRTVQHRQIPIYKFIKWADEIVEKIMEINYE